MLFCLPRFFSKWICVFTDWKYLESLYISTFWKKFHERLISSYVFSSSAWLLNSGVNEDIWGLNLSCAFQMDTDLFRNYWNILSNLTYSLSKSHHPLPYWKNARKWTMKPTVLFQCTASRGFTAVFGLSWHRSVSSLWSKLPSALKELKTDMFVINWPGTTDDFFSGNTLLLHSGRTRSDSCTLTAGKRENR